MSTEMLILIVVGFVILSFIVIYNSLVAKKNEVDNIFASVDVLLKKRFDLIPNLVESVKQYMQYESELLEKVINLRSKALRPNISENEKIKLDKELTNSLSSILVAVENYPELRADKNLLHLQQTLAEIEEQISAARRAYNQAVTDYNNALEMIPSNIIAGLMHYQPKELFEVDENEKKSINLKNLFSN